MKAWHLLPTAILPFLALAACSDDAAAPPATSPQVDAGTADTGAPPAADGGAVDPDVNPCTAGPALSFAPGQEAALQTAVNTLAPCTTITLAAGKYTFTNTITIRSRGITLKGAGKGAPGDFAGTSSTVLDFSGAPATANGVDEQGDWFTIRDLAIVEAKTDALRIDTSRNVHIDSVRAEWAAENSTNNGKYGLYPVSSVNVLLENSEAYGAADAGIYVGQVTNAIVKNNVAKKNVAGLEIENCLHADVSGNTTIDNTAGLVVFDLPENPKPGTDIKLFGNTVTGNNRTNFGASTVGNVPSGTGTFVMASRRVEITGNTYGNNNTTDIALISGLALVPDLTKWHQNSGIADIYIHGNTIQGGSGTSVDSGHPDPDKRPLGYIVYALYAYGSSQMATPRVSAVEPFVWDGIDTLGTDANGKNKGLCVNNNTLPSGTPTPPALVNLDLPESKAALTATPPRPDLAWAKLTHYQPDDPKFGCAGFTPALAPVTLPQ